MSIAGDKKIATDDLRLFRIAAEQELLNAKQVKACRNEYDSQRKSGKRPDIGAIMVHLGYLTPEQLVLVKKEDRRRRKRIKGYEIIQRVGSGALGTVYRAKQLAMDRDVALKVLHSKYYGDQNTVDKYISEARAVAKLNHPHIVQGIDVGESGGCYYLAMEFLSGGTFAKLLEVEGPLDEDRALVYLYQVASALQHAWEKGIIHCDLKPENLMLDKDGRLKITDLGLAQVGDSGGEEVGDGRRVVRGTPHYMSPEQIETPGDLDCRSDIYSLGATFYHLLSGVTPFTGNDNKAIILARLRDTPQSLEVLNPDITKGLAKLIIRMMARNRADRPQTPGELRKAVVDLGVDLGSTGDLVGAIRKKKPFAKSRVSRRRKFTPISKVPQCKTPVKSERRRKAAEDGDGVRMWLGVGIGLLALVIFIGIYLLFFGGV